MGFLCVALHGALANAQPAVPPGAPAAPERALTLREATQQLRASEPDAVLEAIEAMKAIRTPEVVPPLVELLQRGVSDDIMDATVRAFGVIGQPAAIDELSSLLHHRRAPVRLAAVESLGHLRQDPRVRPLLESALRDSDATVRGQAALSLGSINARASVEILQRAFERNVPEAAAALGLLGDFRVAERLLEAVGRAPLSVLITGFQGFLARRDLTDEEKTNIINRLVDRSPTRQVRAFLQEWLRGLPPADRSRARQRAERAVRQIQDQAPGAPSAPGSAAPSAPGSAAPSAPGSAAPTAPGPAAPAGGAP
ncbi:MAG: HEAT repeat domain-containing protein [Deltaproteobacteria bacterium]|nr:HEAT repeat domain-containing protein [Deltaproteobacteria bacterium]